MAKKKVIAYYLHESEEAAIHGAIEDAVFTGAYAMGSMDEDAIAALEADGLVVEVLDSRSDDRPGGDPGLEMISFGTAGHGPATIEEPPRPPLSHPTRANMHQLKLTGPLLLEPWRREIEELGVRLEQLVSPGRYTASLTAAQVDEVERLPFVEEVRLSTTDEASGVVFTELARSGPVAFGLEDEATLVFDVRIHRADEMPEVAAWLERNEVEIVARGRRKVRVEIPKGSSLAREIEALPEVWKIQEYVAPELSNDVARRLLGLVDGVTGDETLTQSGSGEIVAIADSGLDELHPDFQGRVRALIARARVGDPSDLHGHGTHVAGSAVGDGASSGGAFRGTAPAAELVFQSIMDARNRLSGLPVELEELFSEAYELGARIHNDSWSADTRSFYTFSSEEVDEFVYDNPDFLVVLAAGNKGTAEEPFNTGLGFVDWLSMGSPATAKNALTVGASRSARRTGGRSDLSWGQFSRRHFPSPPIADEKVSGDPESLAAFSSRGPCGDGRIKPDLVAPGTDILSTRAATAPLDNFWGPSDDDRYAFMGGTSMAAPLVAGCAALAREYYRGEGHAQPSAALIRATLVNGTRWLTAADAIADHASNPNFHQGFGALRMPLVLPNPGEPWLRLAFADSWQGPGTRLDGTGDRRRFRFHVEGGPALNICLVWTDPPGRSIQNTLGLIVETPLDPPKLVGNQDRPRPLDRLDRTNNVQIVRVQNPPPGDYMAVVFARNLLRPPQDYALVVTGDLAPGGLTEG